MKILHPKRDGKEIIKILENLDDRITIATHRNPDPDGIYSLLILKILLENLGKKVELYIPEETFLDNFAKVAKKPSNNLHIVVDTSSNYHENIKPQIIIDHHEDYPKDFKILIRDPEAYSTGMILLQIAERMSNLPKDSRIKVLNLAGATLKTDTNLYSIKDPKVLLEAYNLYNQIISLGGEYHVDILSTPPMIETSLDGFLLQNLKQKPLFIVRNGFVYGLALEITTKYTGEIANLVSNQHFVPLIIVYFKNNSLKISTRSHIDGLAYEFIERLSKKYPNSRFGGHKNSAGGTFPIEGSSSIKDIAKQILKENANEIDNSISVIKSYWT